MALRNRGLKNLGLGKRIDPS